MSKQDRLREYFNSVDELKRQCYEDGISEDQFKQIYIESLKTLEQKKQATNLFKYWKQTAIVVLLVAIFIYNVKPAYSFVICNLQEYIYPGLRLLRRLSIPIISLFPSLTEWYDETCLIQNPLFRVSDMDCWPCSAAGSVQESADPQLLIHQYNAPFLYKTNQTPLDIKGLKALYLENQGLFDRDASKVVMNGKSHITVSDMFSRLTDSSSERSNVFLWKINRIEPARMLRKVIPRPKVIPRLGQSTERFIIVNSHSDTFRLPDTECNYAFLLFLNGSRVVDLEPAEECQSHCKKISVSVKECYLLGYNWWYWRPVLQPSTTNQTIVAHVGSYC